MLLIQLSVWVDTCYLSICLIVDDQRVTVGSCFVWSQPTSNDSPGHPFILLWPTIPSTLPSLPASDILWNMSAVLNRIRNQTSMILAVQWMCAKECWGGAFSLIHQNAYSNIYFILFRNRRKEGNCCWWLMTCIDECLVELLCFRL